MRFVLKTRVNRPMQKTFAAFDRRLFEYLMPPGAKLIRFDGSNEGDIVHLRLPIAGEWMSRITASYQGKEMAYFVDEGAKLPLGIRDWRHRHIVREDGAGSIIEDDIEFSSGRRVLDWLMYPMLYLAFAPRRRRYQAYFNRTDPSAA